MELQEYLADFGEPVPAWLENFKPGDPFSRREFFASRVVYYPGAGNDGHPVKLFGSTHTAHCFVYPDYMLSREQIAKSLEDPIQGFLGYKSLARIELAESDVTPNGWTPHLEPGDQPETPHQVAQNKITPFAFLEVLAREEGLTDDHGAKRLAILFIGSDGIATYDAMFCQHDGTLPPFAVLVQDHGFGDNYDKFGSGGLLERLALRCQALPKWLLVAVKDNTNKAWQGYRQIDNVECERGGMHRNQRFLFERTSSIHDR